MNPERYHRVGEIYHGALDLPPENRAAFLEVACSGDLDLRREVESLLAAHEQAGPFMSAPAMEVAAGWIANDEAHAPSLSRIGRYEVRSLLASGGMGEVYLAHDPMLRRNVAINCCAPNTPLTRRPYAASSRKRMPPRH